MGEFETLASTPSLKGSQPVLWGFCLVGFQWEDPPSIYIGTISIYETYFLKSSMSTFFTLIHF